MIIYIWFKRIQNETREINKKMKAMNNLCMILLITFASTSNVFTCFALMPPGTHWKVTILNYQDVPLLTHCKSKNNDLGK